MAPMCKHALGLLLLALVLTVEAGKHGQRPIRGSGVGQGKHHKGGHKGGHRHNGRAHTGDGVQRKLIALTSKDPSPPPVVMTAKPDCAMSCGADSFLYMVNKTTQAAASAPCITCASYNKTTRLATIDLKACKGGLPVQWAACVTKGCVAINTTSSKALKQNEHVANATSLTLKLDKSIKCFDITIMDSLMGGGTLKDASSTGAVCKAGGTGVCKVQVCINECGTGKPAHTLKPAPKPKKSPKPSPSPVPSPVPSPQPSPEPMPQAQMPCPESGIVQDAYGAMQLLNAGYAYVDVRSPGEFSAGHVPGAINIPVGDDSFVASVRQQFPDTNTYFLVACLHGGRASGAWDQLKGIYPHCVWFSGSFTAWSDAGLPIEY